MRTCVLCGEDEPTARTTCKGCGAALPPAELLALGAMNGARPPDDRAATASIAASRPRRSTGAARAAGMGRSGRGLGAAVIVVVAAAAFAGVVLLRARGDEGTPPPVVARYVDGATGHGWSSADGSVAAVLPAVPVPEQRAIPVAGVTVPADGVAAAADAGGVYVALAGTLEVPAGIGLDPERVDPGAIEALPVLGGNIAEARAVDHRGRAAVDVRLDLPDGLAARARLVPLGSGRVAVVAIVTDLDGVPGFERLAASMRVSVG